MQDRKKWQRAFTITGYILGVPVVIILLLFSLGFINPPHNHPPDLPLSSRHSVYEKTFEAADRDALKYAQIAIAALISWVTIPYLPIGPEAKKKVAKVYFGGGFVALGLAYWIAFFVPMISIR